LLLDGEPEGRERRDGHADWRHHPTALAGRRQILRDEQVGHAPVVSGVAVASREPVSRMREPVRFPDRAASAARRVVTRLTKLQVCMLRRRCRWAGEWKMGIARVVGRPGSGSRVREGWEIDVPHGGAVLVRAQPVVGAPTAPSMLNHLSEGDPSAFHPNGGGGAPPSGGSSSTGQMADVSLSGGTADGATQNGLRRSLLGLSVKLDKYDGTTCLETFLDSVKNFAMYYRWSEEDELFCLRANLTGAAGHVLWDLSTQVTLSELVRLLRERFGSTDQAERFRTELRTRRRRPNETLQSLYNDICKLMSLAYPDLVLSWLM